MREIRNLFSLSNYDKRKLYYWSGLFTIAIGVLLMVLLITKNVVKNQREVPAVVGGYCAIFATVISIFQILEHLSCFSDPACQTKIVRILFMVPVYGLISWISILNPAASEYLNLVRDAYESYALYAFFSLMLELMGGLDTLYRNLMIEEREPIPHYFPLCWLDPIKVTPRFVQMCRLCIFQFMIFKPLISCIIVILTLKGQMGSSLLDPRHGYLWTTIAYNISISIAFTALVFFYTGLKEFMEGKQPLEKFICIKSVIFLTYWQGILIAIIAANGALPKFDYWSDKDAPTGLQDLLICIEALFIAFGHKFCFGSEEYAIDMETTGYEVKRYVPQARQGVWSNLKYTLKHEDLRSDIRDMVRDR
eukprot:Tbor_TRINITY_DN3361_c0_g1::TRINITY_DN3361_c0_g1_i2::g.23475::m.23475